MPPCLRRPLSKQVKTLPAIRRCLFSCSFAYQAEEGPVLQDISFEIPEGTSLALVGPSGAGKSTAAQLLAGFYPFSQGSIRVGDMRLDENSLHAIQGCIAAVWQDSHLFYGTVEENIRMGRSQASMKDIHQAATKAGIHDFIDARRKAIKPWWRARDAPVRRGAAALVWRGHFADAPILILATPPPRQGKRRADTAQLVELRQGTVLMIAHRRRPSKAPTRSSWTKRGL